MAPRVRKSEREIDIYIESKHWFVCAVFEYIGFVLIKLWFSKRRRAVMRLMNSMDREWTHNSNASVARWLERIFVRTMTCMNFINLTMVWLPPCWVGALHRFFSVRNVRAVSAMQCSKVQCMRIMWRPWQSFNGGGGGFESKWICILTIQPLEHMPK